MNLDPREYGPRAHEYGDLWQSVVAIPVGEADLVDGREVYRSDKNTYEVNDETTSAAGAVEVLMDLRDCQEWPGMGDAWTGGFADNH